MDTPRTIPPGIEPAPTCSVCDRDGAEDPSWQLTWTATRPTGAPSPGGQPRMEHYCDRCSREYLRGIEAKLDPAWW